MSINSRAVFDRWNTEAISYHIQILLLCLRCNMPRGQPQVGCSQGEGSAPAKINSPSVQNQTDESPRLAAEDDKQFFSSVFASWPHCFRDPVTDNMYFMYFCHVFFIQFVSGSCARHFARLCVPWTRRYEKQDLPWLWELFQRRQHVLLLGSAAVILSVIPCRTINIVVRPMSRWVSLSSLNRRYSGSLSSKGMNLSTI